jgi:hypothetical protein
VLARLACAQVHARLKEAGALALLQDDLIATATQVSIGEGITRKQSVNKFDTWTPLPAFAP